MVKIIFGHRFVVKITFINWCVVKITFIDPAIGGKDYLYWPDGAKSLPSSCQWSKIL